MKFGKIALPGYQLPVADGTSGYNIQTNGAGVCDWAEGGGGAGGTMTRDVTQSSHGLVVGDVVRFDGTDYLKAKADTAAHAEVAGIVSAYIGVNDFTLLLGGYITGLAGLTAGSVHFLSETTAGAITTIEPSSPYISKPVLIATSTTAGYFYNMRGADQSGGAGGFGAWETKANNTVYQAATDGFVVAYAASDVEIEVYTDSNNPPTTMRTGNYGNATTGRGGVCCPVRKNDYWKIVGCVAYSAIYWIPDYSGSSSSSSGSAGFGSYETKSINTVYQAGSDGTVVGWGYLGGGGYNTTLVDSFNPPTTVRSYDYDSAGSAYHGSTVPVKKGDYWKYQTGTGTVWFVPDYSGSSSSSSGTYGLDSNIVIVANSGTPNTQVDVNFDGLNIDGYYATNADLTINCATTGANGLDTGSLAADTWYYVWAIADTTNLVTAGLMSLSATAPTLPSGYTKKRLIGYRKTNSGGATLDGAFQFMNNFMHDVPVRTSASYSKNAWSSAVSCNAATVRGMPPGIRVAILGVSLSGSDDSRVGMWVRPNGSTWTTNTEDGTGHGCSSGGGGDDEQRIVFTDASQQIQHYDYTVSASGTAYISVEGFMCGLFSGGGSTASSSSGSGTEDIIARGLELSWNSTTQVIVNPGVLYNGTTKVSKTANTTLDVSSAGDYMSGASQRGTNKWLYVYSDSSGSIKLEQTAPNYADTNGNTAGTKFYYFQASPGKYWRCIGAIRLNATGSGEVIKFAQNGNRIDYQTIINITTSYTGSWSGDTSCSAMIPAISMVGIFSATEGTLNNMCYVGIRPGGSTTGGKVYASGASYSGGSFTTQITCNTDSSQQIQYYTYSAASPSCSIDCEGYYLNIR
jgi:hypothetical protein